MKEDGRIRLVYSVTEIFHLCIVLYVWVIPTAYCLGRPYLMECTVGVPSRNNINVILIIWYVCRCTKLAVLILESTLRLKLSWISLKRYYF